MMAKGSDLLRVENLKTYFHARRGVVRAVDGVSFEVRKGETLGLVGESGCGKSMTMLSIIRLVPEPGGRIVGGKIMFEGEDLVQKREGEMRRIRGKEIAIILQDPLTSLNPAYTIGNQVGEAVSLHQGKRGKALLETVTHALRLVRIPAPETRVRDFPHQMSGGMRQRVCGAMAISCRPALLIADEPTTSLDVTTQAQYLHLLKQLQEELGFGMILVSHDLGIVANICDRVAVMYAGRIVETGDTAELFSHPVHPYTRALLDCVPRLDEEKRDLTTIEGQPPDLSQELPGCRFLPRCQEKVDGCGQGYPPESLVGPRHYVSCWRESP